MASITVIVDRFSKYAIFILVFSSYLVGVAVELFFKFGVKYFSVLTDIVSDRDDKFTG